MLHATYIAGAEVYPSDMMQRDQDFIAPGVITAGDLVVAPTSVPSMAVTVSGATQGSPGGNAWLPGGYRVYNDTQVMLPIAVADATNPRLDLVIATIDTTSTPYSASLQVIMGAPAASPTAPSIPVGLIALTLAQVEVPAGVTSIVAGNITDKRVISGLQGDGSRLRNIPSSAVPVATSTTAGIVKSSSSILVAGDGTLSATPDSIGADPAGAAASAQSAAEAYSDTALAAHQADYVYQTAGGTETAITLTIQETLTNGFPMTFIASAANNAAATTINGKPLYKPNTTTAPNLIAGKAYTVWYNQADDCFFIKASAEGNATVDQVLAGATFSNDSDTGLVGTMSLQAQNIKKGVTYGGITGNLPFLPSEYVGKRVLDVAAIDTAHSPVSYGSTCASSDDRLFFYASSDSHVRKYDIEAGTITDLGAATSTSNGLICCSDDGSVIYAADNSTGAIKYWNGSTWIDTGQVNATSTKICCNADGSELYFVTGSGSSTVLKKWVRATSTVSTIIADANIYPDRISMSWVDDGSIWYKVNSGYGVIKKVRISDGTVLQNIAFTASTLQGLLMCRSASSNFMGNLWRYDSSSASDYLYKLNNDGTFTNIAMLCTGGYKLSVCASQDGKKFALAQGYSYSNSYPLSIQVFDLSVQSTALYIASLVNPPVSATYLITNDANRMFNGYLISNYLYQ